MTVVGVGGFICSGKSFLCERFFRKIDKSLIINADKISREIYSNDTFLSFLRKNCPEAISEFGVNRKIIVEKIVFNPKLNMEFCRISWKLISELINNIIKDIKKFYDVVFVEAALITELDIKFDKLIWVEVSDVDVYKTRIEKRGADQLKKVIGLLEFQRSIYDPTFKRFNYIINNTNSNTSKYDLVQLFKELKSDYNKVINEE